MLVERTRHPRQQRGAVDTTAGQRALRPCKRRETEVGQVRHHHLGAQADQAVDDLRRAPAARARLSQQGVLSQAGIKGVELQQIVRAHQQGGQILVAEAARSHLRFHLRSHISHFGTGDGQHSRLGLGFKARVAFGKNKAVGTGQLLHPDRVAVAVGDAVFAQCVDAAAAAVRVEITVVVTEDQQALGNKGVELRAAATTG